MDLVGMLTAKRMEVAEKIDNHKITEAQATLENAEYASHIADEARHRNLEIVNAQSNIASCGGTRRRSKPANISSE